MRRDLDLIRMMVLAIEDAPTGWAPQRLEFEGYTAAQVGYHSHLLIDAGLAKGHDMTHMQSEGPEAIVTSLTWAGHEFAEAARDESRWRKAVGVVQEKGGSVTIAVLTQLLVTLMKGALGVP